MRATLILAASVAALAAVQLALATPARPHRSPSVAGRDGRRGHRRGPGGVRGAAVRSGAVVVAAVLLAAVVAGGRLPGTVLAVVLVAAGAVWGGAWLVRRVAAEKQAEERRTAVTDYCEALLGELRAGQPVAVAVDRAVAAWPAAHPVASASRLGADVPTALRRLGAQPGGGELTRLAATWELCADTGAGFASGVERLLDTTRVEQSLRRQVRGELASARATAWLVALLPVVVLVAAQSLGGQPWRFLLQTPVGVGCLAVGVSLAAAGLVWIDRIAQRAVQGG